MYMEFWWRDFCERPLEDQEGHGRKKQNDVSWENSLW